MTELSKLFDQTYLFFFDQFFHVVYLFRGDLPKDVAYDVRVSVYEYLHLALFEVGDKVF